MKSQRIKINVKPVWKQKKGHPEPLSGAGKHQDKRTKRKRTRSAKNKDAIEDQK
jgi:hypothetical protein